MSRYCTKCGAVNDSTAQYCVTCQAPLSPVGGYQPMQSVSEDVPPARTDSNLERWSPANLRKSKSPLLALIAFVAIGSVAFLGYQLTLESGDPVYGVPVVRVDVERPIQLQGHETSGEYSLVVRNVSSDAIKEVRITENLPADLEYVSSDPQLVSHEGPQVITWRVAEISANNAVTIKIRIRLRGDLHPGERITTKPTVIYTDQFGQVKTVRFSVEPVSRTE